jgi:uncharacterized NAD(P)/FAD-binding protein YdhS
MDGGGGRTARHVLIIGGGASGALMATHLLHAVPETRITIVEKRAMLGCGVAYATDHPDHLLNTRVHNMSAFPDDPDHFLRWLKARDETCTATEACFVSRGTYGRYLESLVSPWRDDRLRCVAGEVLRVEETRHGISAHLDDGTTVLADRAILATGHAVPMVPREGLYGAWDFTPPRDPQARVVIIGTGLSMVDHVVALLAGGHRGPITCLSRRGLLPQPHASGAPVPIGRGEVPLGAPVSALLRWLRARVRYAAAKGTPWQLVLDGLRPHVSAIWRSWDHDTRARFLRHAATWWEVHRHRMPPQSARTIAAAQASGQLDLVKARFQEGVPMGAQTGLVIRLPGDTEHMLIAEHGIDCRGIRRNPETDSAPVIRDLLGRGLARLDALRLGLDTTPGARVIARGGVASRRLYAIGPCARGALWEITAIPDIRQQTFRLANEVFKTGQLAPVQGG